MKRAKYYKIAGLFAVLLCPAGGDKGFTVHANGLLGEHYNLSTDFPNGGISRISRDEAERIAPRSALRQYKIT
jgi:hypothetical protein